MNDDVRSYIYGTIVIFLVGVMAWVGFLYINACGFTLSCHRGDLLVNRTPVPTLVPATMPVVETNNQAIAPDVCYVAPADLINAWVGAGSSATESFEFTDANDLDCIASFEDVQPLFAGGNPDMIYTGVPASEAQTTP